ncbi:MAG: hypothetical protein WDA59_07165 [Methanofastidiosum sp.]
MTLKVKCPYGVYNSVELYGKLCECSGHDCESECEYNQLTEQNMKEAVEAFNREFSDVPEIHLTEWQG